MGDRNQTRFTQNFAYSGWIQTTLHWFRMLALCYGSRAWMVQIRRRRAYASPYRCRCKPGATLRCTPFRSHREPWLVVPAPASGHIALLVVLSLLMLHTHCSFLLQLQSDLSRFFSPVATMILLFIFRKQRKQGLPSQWRNIKLIPSLLKDAKPKETWHH